MSGRITTPTRAFPAGAAKAAEKSVPSAEVRVRTPRSATSPVRGGAGGRLSWSWHMPRFYRRPDLPAHSGAGGVPRGLGVPAEDGRGHLAPGLGQPGVLPVGLVDQPVEELAVHPAIDFGQHPEGLEPGPLGEHGRGDELELHEIAERRTGEQAAVQLPPRQLLRDPRADLLVLA